MQIFQKVENWLHGQGNERLTIIMLALSALGILVAFFAPPEIKLLVATYWIVP